MYKTFKSIFLSALLGVLLSACGATALISTPIENIDNTPLKIAELSEAEKKFWLHADLRSDTIPGMSVDKAYNEIIGKKRGKTVVVAVMDTGIDLKHEDLDGVLWVNKGERAGNGKDDDKNGYIDDVHGYNFIGEAYHEQLEMTRIVKLQLGDAALQARAKTKLSEERLQTLTYKQQYEQIKKKIKNADAAVKKHLKKSSYSKKDVIGIKTEDPAMQQHIAVLRQMFTIKDTIPEVIEELNNGLKHFTEQLNYHFNPDFDGRSVVGDKPYDITDTNYGNGNPMNRSEDESHGTHVAGIIAAERNNGRGIKGVANNVKIMSLRVLPNGDEYDKDIALGIRYAVDNGAKIINASFGKSFSPNSLWVYDALKYAAENDVLFIHGAGNDGDNMDNPDNPGFPNDHNNHLGAEIVNNVLEVGALEPKYGSEMVGSYSNYGLKNVDVFAPGSAIYSTMPGNKYEFQDGTSMAAPAVTGVAALIRSHYPKLSASQVKKIIMVSGQKTKATVIMAGDPENAKTFDKISKSGKMVNAFNALILAEKVSKGKINI